MLGIFFRFRDISDGVGCRCPRSVITEIPRCAQPPKCFVARTLPALNIQRESGGLKNDGYSRGSSTRINGVLKRECRRHGLRSVWPDFNGLLEAFAYCHPWVGFSGKDDGALSPQAGRVCKHCSHNRLQHGANRGWITRWLVSFLGRRWTGATAAIMAVIRTWGRRNNLRGGLCRPRAARGVPYRTASCCPCARNAGRPRPCRGQ